MKKKTTLIVGKSKYSEALLNCILVNYNFLINFCSLCLINNDNYFDFDNLVEFIYYCKLNNKYSSLISKLYIGDSYNSFRKATEALVLNNTVKAFKKTNELDPNKHSIILYINNDLALHNIYMNKEKYAVMEAFVNDYNKFLYERLSKEDNHIKKLVK